MRLLWHLGLAILCDQVSRNAFRGTPAAYRFDGLARRIAEAQLRPIFDKLPVAIRMSVVLIYVHSEDIADVSVVDMSCGRAVESLHVVKLGSNCKQS